MVNNIIYRFEFSSIYNTNKKMNYVVFAKSESDLSMFIKQHNFNNINPGSITYISPDEFKNESEMFLLKPFKFKSNYNNTLFTVITTEDIIQGMLESSAEELNLSLLFGETILRQDVEVFKFIGETINELPHSHVIDFMVADDESINTVSSESLSLRNAYREHVGIPYDDCDYCVTFDSLFDALNNDVMPITIECYVELFTDMMLDKF